MKMNRKRNLFFVCSALQSVILDKSSEYSSSNQFIFNVTTESDFDFIQSICLIGINEKYPCSNLTIDHDRCSTELIHRGIRGCYYQCYFLTKKFNYFDVYSISYPMQISEFFLEEFKLISMIFILVLPKANLFVSGKGSRFISIEWTFGETVYVEFYQFFLNRVLIATLNGGIFSYSYINLLPNREYSFFSTIFSLLNCYLDIVLIYP